MWPRREHMLTLLKQALEQTEWLSRPGGGRTAGGGCGRRDHRVPRERMPRHEGINLLSMAVPGRVRNRVDQTITTNRDVLDAVVVQELTVGAQPVGEVDSQG